ncbi:hypothetical protein GCM10020229_38310 [Kitasatospora albolonga]|uniref:hypothetical protein n=1 Tax=Kitasatospora albolonga TaxID=68173 RepID=UPI0031ECC8AB
MNSAPTPAAPATTSTGQSPATTPPRPASNAASSARRPTNSSGPDGSRPVPTSGRTSTVAVFLATRATPDRQPTDPGRALRRA